MKKILIVSGLVIITVAGFLLVSSNKPSEKAKILPVPTAKLQELVDIKASFSIYTNGALRIFTDPRYHNLSSEVYIHPSKPNVVNVKKEGITWGDFFKTLPMKLEKGCLVTGTGQTYCNNEKYSLKFYINGIENSSALEETISNRDKLLVSYGLKNDPALNSQVSQIPDL